MSYLKLIINFSLNFASFYSVMRDNSSVFFLAETIQERSPSKCKVSNFHLLMQNFTELVLWQASFVESIWKWHEGFGKFSTEHSKVSKLGLWWNPFVQSRKCINLQFTEELGVMTMKNDTKFEKKLICHFKIDMRNLTKFDPSTRKSPKFTL